MTYIRRAPALSCSTLLLALVLTACGGGGGGGGSPSGVATAASANTNTGEQPTTPPTPAPAASTVDVPPPVGTTPTPTEPNAVTCTASDLPAARASTFGLLNVVRLATQLPQFIRLPALDATAQAHAQYVAANGSSGYDETVGQPCYTGDTVAARLAAAGVVAPDVPGVRSRSENVLTFEAPAGGEVQAWDIVNNALDNVYGRMPLLSPLAQQMGVGFSAKADGQQRAMVFDTASPAGAAEAAGNAWVVWPRDGVTGLPVRMAASNLKPLDGSSTEGYPVSLHAVAAVQVSRFLLTEASSGAAVAATLVTAATDRNGFLSQGEVALVPNAPLAAGTTYRAEIDAMVGTQAVHTSWSFTTR